MIKKFNDFNKVNEEHHLEDDYQGMKDYMIEQFEEIGIEGFLDTLDMDEVTSLYHKVENWLSE